VAGKYDLPFRRPSKWGLTSTHISSVLCGTRRKTLEQGEVGTGVGDLTANGFFRVFRAVEAAHDTPASTTQAKQADMIYWPR
jgi:hypothetical protein